MSLLLHHGSEILLVNGKTADLPPRLSMTFMLQELPIQKFLHKKYHFTYRHHGKIAARKRMMTHPFLAAILLPFKSSYFTYLARA